VWKLVTSVTSNDLRSKQTNIASVGAYITLQYSAYAFANQALLDSRGPSTTTTPSNSAITSNRIYGSAHRFPLRHRARQVCNHSSFLNVLLEIKVGVPTPGRRLRHPVPVHNRVGACVPIYVVCQRRAPPRQHKACTINIGYKIATT
jgi:hypothetical protein